ncbi:hypothetical protein UA08_02473 [Talaromyces atroroseus]|uniref:Uncharacterized protein n=1 Tax=Talaromyces atroroseus TaxID=1441469 RepID=A0A225B5P4_TALAT|nr:hypothetical protein UA08_02473 [Talaromyces atroroseus]OKL62185.1 hypothetical protein UA08_02473 [Talaromyces atroroseus]
MAYNNYNDAPSSSYQQNQAPNPGSETYAPNLSSYQTGPAKQTAGPHQTDFANKLDPRVDSDLNNRAQYAPGTTTSTNVHPGATTDAANPAASNQGPHPSGIKNKLDPRVHSKTGEMTTKTTNGGGTGSRQEPVNPGGARQSTNTAATTGANGVVGGSSTGAPALPTRSSRSDYSREQSIYNPATGSGYTPRRQHEETASGQQQQSGAAASGSKGEGIGQAIKGTFAGIHGAGESIRGNVNAAIDRAFNEPEGVKKNEAIGQEGEYEARSGQFAPSTKQREGFNTGNRRV